MGDIIRVKIHYDGGPAHAATITDAVTGAFYAVIDANGGLPEATIKVYQPVIDVETNAKIINVCAACQRRIRLDSIWYRVQEIAGRMLRWGK